MSDTFRPVFESMKRVADGLIQANEGIKQMADAVLDARDEHEDLKETIARLEGLIVAQGEDLRALRRRIEGTDH